MPDDRIRDEGPTGRDPLDPADLAAPYEPDASDAESAGERGPGGRPAGEPREPVRLRENSVRRVARDGGPATDGSPKRGGAFEEKATSLGEALLRERRRQGLSLSDVEAGTRIRGRMIEALEKGDYDALPSPAYVKGYIQSYADFLDIPAGPLVAQYRSEHGDRPREDKGHPYITAPTPALQGGSKSTKRRAGTLRADTSGRRHLPGPPRGVWLAIVVLALVILSVIGIARLFARPVQQVPPLPQSGPATSSPSASKPASAEATPSGVAQPGTATPTGTAQATTTPAAPPGQFVLVVSVKPGRASWTRITVDGLKAFEGTLPAGTTKTYTVKKKATVRAGQPSALEVTKDGKPLTFPDSNGTASLSITAGN
jgi:cytoskeletal protein RodZ